MSYRKPSEDSGTSLVTMTTWSIFRTCFILNIYDANNTVDNMFSGYSIRSTSQKLPKNSPLYITKTTYLKDLQVGWVGSRISSIPLPSFPPCVKPRNW